MIELNVNPVDLTGVPISSSVITLFMYDQRGLPCPMEPRIRNQNNFFVSPTPYAPIGFIAPFEVYGTATAASFGTSYFGPIKWDGKTTLNIPVTLSFKRPFKAAPRFWKGNMCGVRIANAPDVGTTASSDLIMSWYYDKYPLNWRNIIKTDWKSKDLTHPILSWPDSRNFGFTIEQFISTCWELMDDDFFPCPFLCSKDSDTWDVDAIIEGLKPVLPKLANAKIPMVCIGWELSLWITPVNVQRLIDFITPYFTPYGCRVYVHFQQGYGSDQQSGDFANFWNLNIGKLTGVLHQKILSQTPEEYRYESGGLMDILYRFCGGYNCSDDSGFGHPFDLVALEITAMQQASEGMSEQEGNALGRFAIDSPHVIGPNGVEVRVMGSGNGF